MEKNQYRVAVDIGGTFTDVFVANEGTGEIMSIKVPTSAQDQSIAFMKAIEKAQFDVEQISFLAHGCTTGTNAVIERKGAKTALVTTEGFRDVLEIQRTDRAVPYDLSWCRPVPLVRRHWRRTVKEQMDFNGRVITPLDKAQLRKVVRELVSEGIESIAVCFINSSANPVHERQASKIIGEEAPGVSISISSDVDAKYREYERSSSVCLDAYIKPIMRRYIEGLEKKVESKNIPARLYMMQTSGGMMTAEMAKHIPIFTIDSGPAGGVIAAAAIGKQCGVKDILSLDVGGTSTDVCLIHGNKPAIIASKLVEWGMPARIPTIDVKSVGAGGGSIAWIDTGGLLRVGPQSAGSDPGPVCYGWGGTEPTVSDAFLAKGILAPSLAGGDVPVNKQAAEEVIENKIAKPLGLTRGRAIQGIIDVASANVANALRAVSTWKGEDPRRTSVVAFGGAGAMIGAEVCKMLGIPQMIVPVQPGNASAMGMCMTEFRQDFSSGYGGTAAEANLEDLNSKFAALSETAMKSLLSQGISEDKISLEYKADFHYVGQVYELTIPFASYPVTKQSLDDTLQRFEQTYEEVYGHKFEAGIVEFVLLRLTAYGHTEIYEIPKLESQSKSLKNALKGKRQVLSGDEKLIDVPVYERYALPLNQEVSGPVIIDEYGSTTWVPEGSSFRINDYGHILLKI